MDSKPEDAAFLEQNLAQLAIDSSEAQPAGNASKPMKAKYALTRLKEKLQKVSGMPESDKNECLQALIELDGKVLRGQRCKNEDDFNWSELAAEIQAIQDRIMPPSSSLLALAAESDSQQIHQESTQNAVVTVSVSEQQIEEIKEVKIGTKEMAALELLRSGAKFELVQEIIGTDVDLKQVEKSFLKQNDEEDGINENQVLNHSVDFLTRSKSVKSDDQFFEKLLEQAERDPNKNYMDPILYNVMVDPVVLSSGVVMDRNTILDQNGNLKYSQCPMTRQQLEPKVYPINFLKSELRDWLIDRFKKILFIAEQYRDQKDKFERVCNLAETALKNLGEDIYANEAKKFAQLLLSSPYLDDPEKFAKCYIRVYKTLSQEEKETLFNNDIIKMKEKAQSSFDQGDLLKTQDWLDACALFNDAKLGKYIDTNEIWLKQLKKTIQEDMYENEEDKQKVKKQIRKYQMLIYQSLAAEENSEQKLLEFLEREGLTEEEIVDLTPIQLSGQNLRINESTEDPKLIHQGAPVPWTVRQIKVTADWTDQGWGNKKARLWLRLYRGDDIIHDKDMFGICQRNDPTQRERTYTFADDEIASLSLPGDKYKLYGRSGGGGGHALRVNSIKILLSGVEDNDAEPKVYGPDGNVMDAVAVQAQAPNNQANVDSDYDGEGGLFGDDDDSY